MDQKNCKPNFSISTGLGSALLLCLIVALLQGGCASKKGFFLSENYTLFYDDGDLASLRSAIEQQQHYLNTFASNQLISVGDKSFSVAKLSESLIAFREIIDLEPSPLELDRIIQENFTVFQAGGRQSSSTNKMLVTGYFEPILQGSLTLKPPFIYPVYSPPTDLVERSVTGKKTIGRIDRDGTFLPYWTREEIDNNNIAKGYELAYLKDRFDVFLLHVQGSGKIQLRDGSVKSIYYSTNNGHPYSSIGKLLVDEEKMTLEESSIPAIRKYLTDNHDEEQRILNHNDRYIFFHWGNGEPVRGSIGEPLTPGRSIAIDGNSLPMGMIAYLISQKPVLDKSNRIVSWKPLQRFVLPQDSGSAIKGAGRVDLFWGSGKYAEIAAGTMKEKGYLYFLLKNDFEDAGEKID